MPLSLQTIANIMAKCTGNEILQFGNTFAQNVVIGTNDNNAVEIETNNVSKFRVATSGLISVLTANYKALLANANDIPNKDYVDTQDATKQDTLVSGTNIKTINSTSLLGSGDLVVSSAIASGNILYVSPNATNASGASIASDAWTRAQAIGRQDRPFVTINAAFTQANTNDIVYVTGGATFTALSTTKSICLFLDNVTVNVTGGCQCNGTIILRNSTITSTVQFANSTTTNWIGDGKSKVNCRIYILNGANVNIYNLDVENTIAGEGAIHLYSTTNDTSTVNIYNSRLKGTKFAITNDPQAGGLNSNYMVKVYDSLLDGGYAQRITGTTSDKGIQVKNCVWRNFIFNPDNTSVLHGAFQAFDTQLIANSANPLFRRNAGAVPTAKSIMQNCYIHNAGVGLVNNSTCPIDYILNVNSDVNFDASNLIAPYVVNNLFVEATIPTIL